ncbi:MAG: Glyoxalase/bleomycin resistance protein/dioxygenase [Bacteroidetes bacterium]|jgi:glyoxalase family protein|nr:Glyoxalase/bleomycin resistance protein/dioxygenase [Bacteroidota bacterium]
MNLLGLHHITLICSNARRTIDFYTHVLGFKLVKKTVNFDDPSAYHLYFGNETATPGTLLTFFEWRDLSKGHWGIGTTHHAALIVDSDEAQLKWKRWLQDHGVKVSGPYDRSYFKSIYFTDPDGMILEIATRGPGWAVDEARDAVGTTFIPPPEQFLRDRRDESAIATSSWPEPVGEITPDMGVKGLHHITAVASDIEETSKFYTEVLGLKIVKRTANYDDPSAPHYYFGVGDGAPGDVVTYFGYAPGKIQRGRIGTGMTHNFAFGVQDDDEQIAWRERLLSSGVEVTPVMDRRYFRSVYFWDPDGHMLEISTTGPGFMVDEELEKLGTHLCLPPWLEPEREAIESNLMPLDGR